MSNCQKSQTVEKKILKRSVVRFTKVQLDKVFHAFGWLFFFFNSDLGHLFWSLRLSTLQKAKWSTLKHLLANPDPSVWCNNICFAVLVVVGFFLLVIVCFKSQKRISVLTEPLFDFQFSTPAGHLTLKSSASGEEASFHLQSAHAGWRKNFCPRPCSAKGKKGHNLLQAFFFPKGDGDQLAPATAAYIESPRGKSKVNLQTNVKQFCFFSGWAGDKWKLGRVFSGLLPSSWGHITNYLPFFSASFSSQGHDWAAQTHHPQHATIPQHL